MKLQRLMVLAGLLMMTTVGCCHSQCVSSNPCNPCGTCGGGCLTGWLKSKLACCRMSCHNYSWCDDCSSACSVCGGTNCGLSSPDMGMPSAGGSTCACGQSHGATYVPSSPTSMPNDAPAPIPTQVAPVPPRSSEPTPAPGSTDSTSLQQPGSIQHVSVEEFQRLPGVVISGPAQSSVPTMAQPALSPPALSTVSTPPKPLNNVQQVQWQPSKQ
ncbi:MAG: hypothetical protein JSS49_27350 [Planctomycetes bacterium]|nr:hypothetical protein [Planctomycetota bacterium]